ncbi:hypothetical protein J7J95_00290 [bacterium]|nr:hypothetical protein [bacterium]
MKIPAHLLNSQKGAWLIVGKEKDFSLFLDSLFANWQIKRENNPQLLLLNPEGEKVGIDSIRSLKKFFSRKKWGEEKRKLAVILKADTLSGEAQNALLKTLEELKTDEFIFLHTPATANILPTIASRCQFFHLPSSGEKEVCLNLEDFAFCSIPERIAKGEKQLSSFMNDPEKLRAVLESTLTFYQQKLTQENPPLFQIKKWLEVCQQAIEMLKANIKPISVVDWLMMNL